MDKFLNINSPILPNLSLGGIRVGQHISELKDWIQFNMFMNNRDNISCKVFNGLYVNYSCLDGQISFTINIVTGKVIFVNANYGYEGELFNGIKPGMTFFELKSSFNEIFHRDGFLYLKGIKGLRIDIPDEYEVYDELEAFPDFIIETITVYDESGDNVPN